MYTGKMVLISVDQLQEQIEEICDRYEEGDDTVYCVIDNGKPTAVLVKYKESKYPLPDKKSGSLTKADLQYLGEIGYI